MSALTAKQLVDGQGFVIACQFYDAESNSYIPGLPEMVIASDGVLLPIGNLAKTYGQSGGQINTITVSYAGETYVQTLTYSNGLVATESKWVKQ